MRTDEEIDALIRQSQAPITLKPDFSAEVWRRVALAEAASPRARWNDLVARVMGEFFRPVALAGSFVLAIGSGLWVGWRTHENEADQGRLVYVQSISPFVPKTHKTP
jgi:hypothetical protein